MPLKVSNNASSALTGSILTGSTSIAIDATDAALFPTLSAGDWFPLTIVDTAGNREIVKVTARSGGTLTVTRAQEGTTARAFAAGSKCDLRLTAAAIQELGAVDNDPALTAASATKAPSQSAVKTYVDGLISTLKGGVSTAFDTLQELAANFANYLPLAGGTLNGSLTIDAPTMSLKSGGGNAYLEIFRSNGTVAGRVRWISTTNDLVLEVLNAAGSIITSSIVLNGGSASFTFNGNNVATEGNINALIAAATTLGALGVPAFLAHATTAAGLVAGGVYAGSSLRYAGFANGTIQVSGTAPTGSWRCVGYSSGVAGTNSIAVFVRVI